MNQSYKDNDDVLVGRLQGGDDAALIPLVKKWHKLFCDKAYWLVKDKDVAKDVAQESWTVIMNRIGGLKDRKQFKYWAYRIICNKSADWLRLQAKKHHQILGYDAEIERSTDEYSENEPLKKALLKAINELPIHQKTVIRLFYIESYSLKEISAILDIAVGTAKSRLFHARERLKKELNTNNDNY